MQFENRQKPIFYLRCILANGVMPFLYRGRACSLLGVPDSKTGKRTRPQISPSIDFIYPDNTCRDELVDDRLPAINNDCSESTRESGQHTALSVRMNFDPFRHESSPQAERTYNFNGDFIQDKPSVNTDSMIHETHHSSENVSEMKSSADSEEQHSGYPNSVIPRKLIFKDPVKPNLNSLVKPGEIHHDFDDPVGSGNKFQIPGTRENISSKSSVEPDLESEDTIRGEKHDSVGSVTSGNTSQKTQSQERSSYKYSIDPLARSQDNGAGGKVDSQDLIETAGIPREQNVQIKSLPFFNGIFGIPTETIEITEGTNTGSIEKFQGISQSVHSPKKDFSINNNEAHLNNKEYSIVSHYEFPRETVPGEHDHHPLEQKNETRIQNKINIEEMVASSMFDIEEIFREEDSSGTPESKRISEAKDESTSKYTILVPNKTEERLNKNEHSIVPQIEFSKEMVPGEHDQHPLLQTIEARIQNKINTEKRIAGSLSDIGHVLQGETNHDTLESNRISEAKDESTSRHTILVPNKTGERLNKNEYSIAPQVEFSKGMIPGESDHHPLTQNIETKIQNNISTEKRLTGYMSDVGRVFRGEDSPETIESNRISAAHLESFSKQKTLEPNIVEENGRIDIPHDGVATRSDVSYQIISGRSNENAMEKIEQLRHAVHQLASKTSSAETKNDVALSGYHEKKRVHEEQILYQPMKKVVIAHRPFQQTKTPLAFWERCSLNRFHLKLLR
jgi:hypothetical protein